MNIPKGYKLVPVEPTEEMLDAAYNAPLPMVWLDSMRAQYDLKTKAGYKEMLAAAPTPPKPIYDEAKERELFEAQFLLTPKRWASGYEDRDTNYRWKGWLACAQSRAKAGEDM